MKKTVVLFAALMMSGAMLFAQVRINFDVISGRRAPNPAEAQAMRAEEVNHPRITEAMHKIEDALNLLNAAPDNFGGHKVEAISTLQQSLWSLRKALYYRIYQDR
jgi:hypothetical protein